MTEATAVYTTRVSGFWNPRHTFMKDGETLGVLKVHRGSGGMIVGGEYRPEKGEVLLIKRDPGLLRSQFSIWTDQKEWLGSSLRWSFVNREVHISTGSKPFTLMPVPSFQRGWGLFFPKTGEAARITAGLVARDAKIEVFRRIDFEHLLFAYFVGSMLYTESLWPCRAASRAAQAV